MTEKRSVRTEAAPAPFQGAPYSQAIVSGGLVFVSGPLGLAPGAATLADGIEAQTRQALENLGAILAEAGCGLERLVKTTVFLADLGDFADRFLRELAEGAGITLHVRLVEGRETQHVLDAIFKALGAALGAACRGRSR